MPEEMKTAQLYVQHGCLWSLSSSHHHSIVSTGENAAGGGGGCRGTAVGGCRGIERDDCMSSPCLFRAVKPGCETGSGSMRRLFPSPVLCMYVAIHYWANSSHLPSPAG